MSNESIKKFHFFDVLALASGGDIALGVNQCEDLHFYDGSVRKAERYTGQYMLELVEHLTGQKIILSEDGSYNGFELDALIECAGYEIFSQCPVLHKLFEDNDNNVYARLCSLEDDRFEESKEEYVVRIMREYGLWHDIRPMPPQNVYRVYPAIQVTAVGELGLN